MRLESVVDRVLARNPTLNMAQLQVEKAKSDWGEVRSLRLPKLAIRSALIRGDNPVYVFGSLLEQESFGPENFAIDSLNNPDYLTNIKNALDLGLPIFMGFEISTGEKIRKLYIEQSREQYGMIEQKTLFDAMMGYLAVLRTQEKCRMLVERLESANRELVDAKKLNAKGLVLGSDYFAAQAILSGLKARHSQALVEFETAKKSLAIVMGEPLSSTETFKGGLSESRYKINEENDWIKTAFSNRRDLRIVDLQNSMADLSYDQSKRGFYPKIEAFASLETNTEDFESNPTNRMVGVRSHFPIGDPSYFSRRSQAKTNAQLASSQKKSIEESVRLEVLNALQNYLSALSSLSFVQNAVEESKKSLEMFRPLYREGRQSILDVLKAEEGLVRAQEALIDNQFQIHGGYARLQLVIGELGPSTLQMVQANLEKVP